MALEKLPNLTSLEVVNGRESLDLSVVSECCMRLQSLQVFYSRGVHISSSQDLRFPSLKKLTIYATEESTNMGIKMGPRLRELLWNRGLTVPRSHIKAQISF